MTNSINIISNFDTSNVSVNATSGQYGDYSIDIGFTSSAGFVRFDSNFRFTISIVDDETSEVIVYEEFPKGATRYISTDQQYLVSFNVSEIFPLKNYTVSFSYVDGSTTKEIQQQIQIPLPPKPFNSWSTWDNELHEWLPPTPVPTNLSSVDFVEGSYYYWDEASLSWVLHRA